MARRLPTQASGTGYVAGPARFQNVLNADLARDPPGGVLRCVYLAEVLVSQAEESFTEYVRARLTSLSRAAFLLTGEVHAAEDLVQQTLIQVAARWERIVANGDPEPYVRRVLYRQHISLWRRHRRDPMPVESLPERPGPDDASMVAVSLAVREALARLTPKQRAVIVLRFFDDLTEAQAAAVLDCSVSTVKSHTRDGLARLRSLAPELAEVFG